jgi:putative FmdB family regulatory protein
MPVYEYKCDKCEKNFELFQKMSDPVAKKCLFCNGPVTKQISMTTFHLKGGGWYVTDYGGKKAPAIDSDSGSTDKCASCPSSGEGASCAAAAKSDD